MTIALPRNCTFDADDWQKLAQHWYPIALSIEVVDKQVGAKLLDVPLVVYRVDGEVTIADDICPHRGVPLSLGTFDGAGITCAYHGLHYGKGGRCDRIPADPGANIPARLHLNPYPAVERYGLVWTCLAARGQVQEADIPVMPHWDDAGFQQINCPWIDIFGFAGRQVEGFLDVAHFGFVHLDTFGDPDNTLVPAYVPKPTEKGFEVEYFSNLANYPRGVAHDTPADYRWLRHFQVHLPFTAVLTVHFPDGGRLVIMNNASPVSARVTRLFCPIARNFGLEIPVQAIHDFNRRVFEEDKEMVEAQRPEWLPLDPSMEAHIMADRSSIAYRKGLRAMGFSTFFTA
jgi:phenylpropionate dioxygenase-like ring-hydroxylating dioxygenase large terminal subunit